jgi:hypothetical protein
VSIIGFIGEKEQQVKRVYEDPFAEPAPQAPDTGPAVTEAPAPAPAVPVPA